MKKIIFANNYYYLRGGSERVLFDEMAWLAERGHIVIPFSRRHEQNCNTAYDRFYLPAVDFDGLRGLEKARAAIDIVYSRPMKRAFGALLDQEVPEVVHGHNIYSGLSYSIIDAAKARSIPFVLTLHDLKLACPSYLMMNRGAVCERCRKGAFWHCVAQRCHKESLVASAVITAEAYWNRAFRMHDWVARFFCPSRFLLEKMAGAGLPREKLVHLPNALDPTRYEPSYGPGAYVLFAGRLSPEKGIVTLLQACKGLDVTIRLAGTGPMWEECREFAEANGMGNVVFEGYCQGEKLKDLFRRAAFLVMPSGCYENAPMSILEAFAFGKPVLGSNIGGIPELVRDGHTGTLFKAGNVDDLRDKVVWMWNHRSEVVEMGKNARHRVETEFSVQTHVDRLEQTYESVLG